MKIEEISDRLDYEESGEQRTIVTGDRSCSWEASSPPRYLDIIVSDRRDRLVDVYRSRLLPIFLPFEVGGLPAVEEKSALDAVTCSTTIDLGQSRGLDIQVVALGDEDGKVADPCAEGRRVAEAIVAALPPA